MPKKNMIIFVIIILIFLSIITVIVAKNKNLIKLNQDTDITESDVSIDQALHSDTITSINTKLDNIKIEDTSNTDMGPIDNELNNL